MSAKVPRPTEPGIVGPLSVGRAPSVPGLVRLFTGLVAFGFSMALMVEARLGLGPWDVLHQGISTRAGVALGWVVIAVGATALLGWVPLRQRPGLGTVSNVVVIGLVVDGALAVLPSPRWMPARLAFLLIGVAMNGAATGLYIGAGLGAGPRDGLMTGLAGRGYSIRAARTGIELVVLAVGILLGGSVGIGTLVFAGSIGPLAHYFLPRFGVEAGSTAVRAPRHPIEALVVPEQEPR